MALTNTIRLSCCHYPKSICAKLSHLFALSFLLCFGKGEARLMGGIRRFPNETYTVCSSPGEPFVACTMNTTSTDPDATFTGYSVAVFQHAALMVGWTTSDYVLVCMDWNSINADIMSLDGICDVTASDVPYVQEAMDAGVQYAYPDWKNAYVLVVHATSKIGGQWLFLQPFTWPVWLMLLAAAIAVGLAVHLVEVISKQYSARDVRMEPYIVFGENGWADSMWTGLGLIVNAVDPFSAVTIASRIIVFVWCFMILLLLTMYTGNAAAILTINTWSTPVKSRLDLPGHYWGCTEGAAKFMPSLGFTPDIVYPWNNDDDQALFLNALRDGKVAALVLDSANANAITSQQCDFHQVDEAMGGNSCGLSFAATINSSLVAQFSKAVLAMENLGDLDRLRKTFLEPLSTCNGAESGANSIEFGQVSGLWIVLSATICAALSAAICINLVNRYKMMQSLKSKVLRRTMVVKKCDHANTQVSNDEKLAEPGCNEGKSEGLGVRSVETEVFERTVEEQVSSLEKELGALKATLARWNGARLGEV